MSDADDLVGWPRQRMLLAYSIGDAGTGMAASLIGFYLFIFYTSAAGLPAWMAGLVLMLARLWDAINDPLVGWLSDKTRRAPVRAFPGSSGAPCRSGSRWP